MANKQLWLSSPSSSENCLNDSRYSWFSHIRNGSVMNAELIYRTNNTNGLGSAPDANYFPFWARKCRCAECIIAKNTMEAKSLASNKYWYSHLHQSNDYSSQARDGYYSDRLTKANLDQAKPVNTNGITRWPGKEPFTTSSERRPIVSQNEMGHVTTKLDHHKILPQFATIPDVNKTKLSTQFLGPEMVKGDKAAANNHESGFGNPANELNYQKQQFKNIYQTNPSRYLRDPRLKNHGKSDSIYQGQTNFVSVAEFVGTEGYRKPSEQTIAKRYREETRPSQQNTMPPTWWDTSSERQCLKSPAHAQSNYQKRSAATVRIYRDNSKSSEEWKLQTWERHMQSSPARLIKHGINETFFREKDSRSRIPQTTPPITKTCRTSKSDGTISIRSQQPFIDTKKRNLATHCTPDQTDFELSNTNSLKKNKELHIIQDAKDSEICAREERIRNLKILLEKQERALETLRFQRKTPFTNETGDAYFTCNEDRIKKSSDPENIAIMEECHLTDDVVILGNNSGSLKRRWLKNWKFNEKDEVEHKSASKIKKRKEIHTDSKETEGKNQNLSNAEYTAVEGLVRLGKD